MAVMLELQTFVVLCVNSGSQSGYGVIGPTNCHSNVLKPGTIL